MAHFIKRVFLRKTTNETLKEALTQEYFAYGLCAAYVIIISL